MKIKLVTRFKMLICLLVASALAQTELNDENFEHLTQATTGSTTGDWYILVHDDTDESVLWLAEWAKMSSLEHEQENQINIAVLNFEANPQTVKQIRAKRAPDFKYLNQGMVYEIPLEKIKTAEEARKKAGRYTWYKGRQVRELDGVVFKFFGTITAFLLNSMA